MLNAGGDDLLEFHYCSYTKNRVDTILNSKLYMFTRFSDQVIVSDILVAFVCDLRNAASSITRWVCYKGFYGLKCKCSSFKWIHLKCPPITNQLHMNAYYPVDFIAQWLLVQNLGDLIEVSVALRFNTLQYCCVALALRCASISPLTEISNNRNNLHVCLYLYCQNVAGTFENIFTFLTTSCLGKSEHKLRQCWDL